MNTDSPIEKEEIDSVATGLESKPVFPKRLKKKKSRVSSAMQKLIAKPGEYAEGAIAALSLQLANAKTVKRKQILQGRLDTWIEFDRELKKESVTEDDK